MTPANCPHTGELPDLVAGRLSGDRLDSLTQHLEGCASCLGQIAVLSADDEFVRLVQKASLPDLSDPVIQRVRERWQTGTAVSPLDATKLETQSVNLGETRAVPRDLSDEFAFLSAPVLPDEIGRLGRYRILNVLGQGGMGVVFRAEDAELQREVAVKVLRGGTSVRPELRQRFAREARTLAAIDHSGVVTIHSVEEVDGIPFLTMQLLQGQTLAQHLAAKEQLSVSEVLKIGEQLADALAVAHEKQIIHRDIKPANIWIDSSGQVKLIDFGLARCDDLELTVTGQVMGTPRYMSPEQINGEPATVQSDLFSLGAVLYELAVGEPPFRGENLTALTVAIVHNRKVPVAEARPQLDRKLCELIERLLATEPSLRYPDTATVRNELRRIKEASGSVSQRSVVTTATSAAAHTWKWLTLGVLVAAVAVAVVVTMDSSGRRSPSHSDNTDLPSPPGQLEHQPAADAASPPDDVNTQPLTQRDRQLAAMKAIIDLGGWVALWNVNEGQSLTYDDLKQLPESSWEFHHFSIFLQGISSVADEGLRILENVNLHGIWWSDLNISGECFQYLVSAKELKHIDLFNCQMLESKYASHLANHRKLRYLHVQKTPLGDEVAEIATRLPDLDLLKLGMSTTDRALDYLVDCPSLRFLSLSDCPKITTDGICSVSRLSVETLQLDGNQLDSQVIEAINATPTITGLEVWGPPFPTSLLGKLRRIEVLKIARFGKLNTMQFNAHELSTIPSLKAVRIWLPGHLQEQTEEQCRAALPHCKISKTHP